MTIDAVCSQCKKDMTVEPQGDFIRLACVCGNHKLVNTRLVKTGKSFQLQRATWLITLMKVLQGMLQE